MAIVTAMVIVRRKKPGGRKVKGGSEKLEVKSTLEDCHSV